MLYAEVAVRRVVEPSAVLETCTLEAPACHALCHDCLFDATTRHAFLFPMVPGSWALRFAAFVQERAVEGHPHDTTDKNVALSFHSDGAIVLADRWAAGMVPIERRADGCQGVRYDISEDDTN